MAVNLDELIEDVVFHKKLINDYGSCPTCGYTGCYRETPMYGSDIAAAFLLLDEAKAKGINPSLEWDGTEWICTLTPDSLDDSYGYVAIHKDAHIAICYAVLRWNNIEPSDEDFT